jgi:hypothetical protein
VANPRALPRRLLWQVTDRCNSRCRHCAYDGSDQKSGRLDAGLAGAFLQAFSARFGPPSHIGLSGGEPSLFFDSVLELCRLGAATGARLRLCTNASWAASPGTARQEAERLKAAGLSGLWVGAGSFQSEHIPPDRLDHLLEAAAPVGLACYLNFTYLRPAAEGLRGRGLPGILPGSEDDRRTEQLHRTLAAAHPGAEHGWARILDRGRARQLFNSLAPETARQVRRELAGASRGGIGALDDLLSLSVDGLVFLGARQLGRFSDPTFNLWFTPND